MQTNHANLADRLLAESPGQRAQVKERFVDQLRGDLDALVTLLAGEALKDANRIDPASAEYCAVEILQFVRYRDAAELFVQHLGTRSTAYSALSDEKQADYPFFPFALAAAAIGMPAIASLTKGISVSDPATTHFQLCCLVLKEILGEELALQHLENVGRNEAPLSDAQRMEQVSRFIHMRANAWNAKLCSDYSAR